MLRLLLRNELSRTHHSFKAPLSLLQRAPHDPRESLTAATHGSSRGEPASCNLQPRLTATSALGYTLDLEALTASRKRGAPCS
jgi:hypothetical protein